MNLNLIETLGWTLVHSIWQIALIGACLHLALVAMKRSSANARYAAAVLALSISVIVPVATSLQLSRPGINFSAIDRARAYDLAAHDDRGLLASGSALHAQSPSAAVEAERNIFEPLSGLRQIAVERFPTVFPLAIGLWLLGVGLFSFRLVGGVWRLQQYRSEARTRVTEEWQGRFAALCNELGVTANVMLISSRLVKTPIAVGVFKPLIIVPASIFLQMHPRQLESILAHELIHIRRYDPFVNILQNIAEVLFFYHPGVWFISAVMRREREFAADAAVVAAFADASVVYAKAPANLEEIRQGAKETLPSMATAANGGNLMIRIQRILHEKAEITNAYSAWSAGLACAIISALLLAVLSFTPSSFVKARAAGSERKIAVGFVSIPPVDRSENPPKDSDATARLVIAKLQHHKVPAIGFVTGGAISDGEKLYPVRANIVRLWRDAGLEVGVGSFKHVWFYHTPYDEYVAGVEKNAALTRKLLAEKNIPLKYFSYPFLNTGKNAEERGRFEAWLSDQGLRSVKYTVDNQEWMYSYAYDMARNDNDLNTMNEVRVAFIKYMDRMFEHYEAYSQETFGRDIAQTMVLTPSRLVADSADDLFGLIRKRGYKFVSMDEALSDAAYSTPENVFGKFGISWFERWTQTAGKKLREEPAVDPAIEKTWNERSAKK